MWRITEISEDSYHGYDPLCFVRIDYIGAFILSNSLFFQHLTIASVDNS